MDEKLISALVDQVLDRIRSTNLQPAAAPVPSGSNDTGVFENMHDAIDATIIAQKKWTEMKKRDREKVIAALRQAMHDNAETFARMAQKETGMGRVEDKIVKHHNAADATPGTEDLEGKSWTGDYGLVYEDWAPYGVIGAVTPSTHPIPVMLNSTIMMIAGGNGVVFNVHPAAKNVSVYAMEIFTKAIFNSGGPLNLISMVREPTMATLEILFKHPSIPMIAATGGPLVVQAAFKAGKKVVAAGPGNPPVLVDETACLERAAKRIIDGATFDNNILCIAEKEVFVVEKVFDEFMKTMEKFGAFRLNAQQIDALVKQVFSEKNGHIVTSRDFIGKNANVLGRAVGLNLSDDIRLLFGETDSANLFVQEEQMMPFLPIVKIKDAQEGIELAVKAEHGFKHTAMIYSNNLDVITKFNKAIDTDIVVVNGASYAGNGGYEGEAYFSHTIASPTGEGICTPRNFARIRRLAMYKSLQMY
ncbi:aldehyde dehydrogenase EutE [candidate division KSB1 bacterium]|nr:aldehyde dehydrogenase EutE [candidate division KSB1 bacterium]RQW00031.1 MAG: aldehyde dehydrogenase EutE [candidate division KSB1 bacterium]